MADAEKVISYLNTKTLVPFGFVLSIFLISIGAYNWLLSEFQAVRNQIRELQYTTMSVTNNRWTAQDMEIFQLRLKLMNPDMKIPEVSDIVQKRLQASGLPDAIK